MPSITSADLIIYLLPCPRTMAEICAHFGVKADTVRFHIRRENKRRRVIITLTRPHRETVYKVVTK